MTAAILLALVAMHMAMILWRGRAFRGSVGRSRDLHGRAAVLRGWAMGVAVTFGLPAVIGLALLGGPAPWDVPPRPFWTMAHTLYDAGLYLSVTPLIVGMVAGTVANAGISVWRARTGRRPIQIGHFPDIRPQTGREVLPAILLSVSAGVSEELYFRLLLPLLIALVSGSAPAGFGVAALLFGAVHRYQGVRGVVATTLGGSVLAFVYLGTGALWVAMLFHIVIDLNALIVRPMAARLAQR
ncbi:hypothetical protein ASE75_09265 [Sphingomonas sp. Leaf17]|uniref:CPBP family intramembrane glutamic endopeptidase n=1 Tax=Sphingomonas sp. Leaf17 TaxID=1735683 RepID=UPI0006F221C4|nr:CPBP family intramembrane glutamic endopeptidase [Sphingomonas sp. Leaf17]KQM64183.1 hypothetical protein ASE75_09265 [Sphingomonas sp. Leaf17]